MSAIKPSSHGRKTPSRAMVIPLESLSPAVKLKLGLADEVRDAFNPQTLYDKIVEVYGGTDPKLRVGVHSALAELKFEPGKSASSHLLKLITLFNDARAAKIDMNDEDYVEQAFRKDE